MTAIIIIIAMQSCCWVCLHEGIIESGDACFDGGSSFNDDDDDDESRRLLKTGCACRGSGGVAHVRCVASAAAYDVRFWTSCPTCFQDWTGPFEVAISRARWEGVRSRPAEDPERLFVASNLAVTLQESGGDPEGAAALISEVLDVRRRTLGDDHPDTLDSITNLALHYSETGNYAKALGLSREVVAAHKRTAGDVMNVERAHAVRSLAAALNLMGKFTEARPLHERVLAFRKEHLGEEHLDTLNSTYGFGQCLVGLGEEQQGMAMIEHAASAAARIFGKNHPSARHFASGLEKSNPSR